MTNNKSECKGCKKYGKREGCYTCGDSLRKQEERGFTYSVMPSKVATKQEEITCCEKCLEYDDNITGETETCGDSTCSCHTPKVATSEKESEPRCTNPKCWAGTEDDNKPCQQCNKSVFPTPHESEDWDFEYSEFITEFERLLKEFPKEHHIAFNFGKKFMSKVYQRGREEGYTEGVQSELNYKSKLDDQNKRVIRNHLLSLAVQEIENKKEEMKRINGLSSRMWLVGLITGLDKAIEIISGLKSKE